MEYLMNGLVLGELAARRSRVLERSDRDRVRLRAGILALAGVPPVVTVADSVQEVRRIERREQAPERTGTYPGGVTGFINRGQSLVAEFSRLAEAAEEDLQRVEASLEEGRNQMEERQEELEVARAGAQKMAQCAEDLEAIFAEGDNDGGGSPQPAGPDTG